MGSRNVIPQAALYQIQTFNANGKRIIASNKLNILAGIQFRHAFQINNLKILFKYDLVFLVFL